MVPPLGRPPSREDSTAAAAVAAAALASLQGSPSALQAPLQGVAEAPALSTSTVDAAGSGGQQPAASTSTVDAADAAGSRPVALGVVDQVVAAPAGGGAELALGAGGGGGGDGQLDATMELEAALERLAQRPSSHRSQERVRRLLREAEVSEDGFKAGGHLMMRLRDLRLWGLCWLNCPLRAWVTGWLACRTRPT